MVVPIDGTGTASVASVMAPPVPGHARTSLPVRKTVLGPSRGGAGKEGEETSGSEKETRLVAAGLPGCEPGGLPR